MPPTDDVLNLTPTAVREAADYARSSATEILRRWEDLPMAARRQILAAFREAIIPKRRPGRKRNAALTAAYEAWKGGTRGVALFRNHIPRWERLSRWRREAERRSLMDAIYSRNRRERAKQVATADEARPLILSVPVSPRNYHL